MNFNRALCVWILSFAAPVCLAQQTLLPTQSYVGDTPDAPSAYGDAFGTNIDTWKDWVFVGAPREWAGRSWIDPEYPDSYWPINDGAVYVYKRVDGHLEFQQKITHPGSSGGAGEWLGSAVVAKGGWLFIASANDQDFPLDLEDPAFGEIFPDIKFVSAGQVHVYRINGDMWEYSQTIYSPEPRSFGHFGARSHASRVSLSSNGKVAVIGESDSVRSEAGLLRVNGRLHVYHSNPDGWQLVQTIEEPENSLVGFGDSFVFASDKILISRGLHMDFTSGTAVDTVYAYKLDQESQLLLPEPVQIVDGKEYDFANCPYTRNLGPAAGGLAAGGGTLIVGTGCYSTPTAEYGGRVDVYSLGNQNAVLTHEHSIFGDVPELLMSINRANTKTTLAVNDAGDRIMIAAPIAFAGQFNSANGEDILVYEKVDGSWELEVKLASPTPKAGQNQRFGAAVFFLDDDTALVHENNFLIPIVYLKSQAFIYDLGD